MRYSGYDVDAFMLGLCIWREARGESKEGQIAIAWVIKNRMVDTKERWGTSIYEVIRDPLQFSSMTHQGDLQLSFYPTKEVMLEYMQFAEELIADDYLDPTGGANHYHATYVSPSWGHPDKITATIGNHIFYRL